MVPLGEFSCPFLRSIDFGGVTKVTVLQEIQHEVRKNEVQERAVENTLVSDLFLMPPKMPQKNKKEVFAL